MTAQELKNSILQLAVQGKLVPQDKNDEPASELLKRIQAEKARLIKEGKIKKEKALPPIAEEELPFDIPESWEWVRLGDFCCIYNGNSINTEEKMKKYASKCVGYDFIATKDVGFNHSIAYENGIYIPVGCDEFKIAPKGSVLLCMEGGSAGRKIGLLEKDVCFGNKLCCLTPYVILSKYLYYFLQTPTFFGLFTALMTGIIGGVGAAKIKSIVIPIPPLAEQQRIVDKIEELLPLVEKYGKAETRLKELNADFPDMLRKSILQQAVQGKLSERDPADEPASELLKRIQAEKAQLIKDGKIKKEKPLPPIAEDEIPFDIPDTWQWVCLLDVLKSKPTNGFSPKSVEYITSVRNLTLTATTCGRFKNTEFKYVDISQKEATKYWLKNNDLLIQRSNSRELVGTSCIYTGEDDEFIYPDLIMRMRVVNDINLTYIDYVLKSPFVRRYYMLSSLGTSESMPKINQKVVSKTLIPIPPFEEQKRIVARVEELLALCDQLKK